MSISDNQIMQYFLSALAVFNTYCRKGQWGFNPLIKQQLQPRLLELVTLTLSFLNSSKSGHVQLTL